MDTDAVEWGNTYIKRRSTADGRWCEGHSSTQPVKDRQFRRTTIDHHAAAIRSSCGYVEAVVAVRDRIYELSLQSPHVGPGGDEAAFALLSPRIDVGTSDGASVVWSQTFVSRLHGYVLKYPLEWRVSPASATGANDVYRTSRSRTRLSITIRSKPASQPLDQYADALLPHHAKDDGCYWNSLGIIWIPAGKGQFEANTIAGHPAVVRSECDFIEAVVDLRDHALVLSLHSGKRMPNAERTLFDLFAAALEVTEPTA
jgi:hypothetical protein